MRGWNLSTAAVICITATIMLSGCVERQLTINTVPSGAIVTLGDEEIGQSPVTTSFEWYGDYEIRISKQGFETLKTHRRLKGPWYDAFPFDFFSQILWPKRIVDSYEWTFELKKAQPPGRDELIENARKLKKEL